MMELADMRDLGSRGAIRWGSSPHARTKRDKQAETSLFVSFYPTNKWINAVLERIFKKIRSIFIPKENLKQSAEDIKH